MDGTRLERTFCFLAGRIHNLPLLAEDLALEPVTPAERVLAAAYTHWGEGMLPRLRGTFVLVLWEAEAGRGILAVDQLGSGPLFLCADDERLLFAGEVRELLTMLRRRPSPNRVALVRWLAGGSLPRGETLYEGVQRLEGGHCYRLDEHGWEKSRYWAPAYAAPAKVRRADLIEELRLQVSRAVHRGFAGHDMAGLLVSGGIDSSALAAHATKLTRDPVKLSAYSAVFPTFPSMDESAFIERVTDELALGSKRLAVHGGSMLAGSLEFLSRWEVPSVSPNVFFGVPLLRFAAADKASVFLDGEGGDELFGSAQYLLADRLRAGRVLSMITLARRLVPIDHPAEWRAVRRLAREYAAKGALPLTVHEAARRIRGGAHYAPGWFNKHSAELYVETSEDWLWKGASGPRWWASLADVLTVGRERSGSHDFLRRKAALAGIAGAHPFLEDLDLIQFVLRIPPELSFDRRFDRPLLRDSMDGLMPDAVRLRQDKSDFMPLFIGCLTGPDRAPIWKLLSDRHAAVYAFVRRDLVAKELLTGPPQWRRGAWAWALWRLVTAECWLRFQADMALPERVVATWGLEGPRFEHTVATEKRR